jgi:hypothetical protein
MYPVQLAGLRLLFVQCRNKFGGPTHTSLPANNVGATKISTKIVKKRNVTHLFGTFGKVGPQNAAEITIGEKQSCL